MKLLWLILSVYVIMLSVKPCCADYDCQGRSIAVSEHSQNPPGKDQDCPGCSPFFTCCSGIGFIIAQPLTVLPSPVSADRTEYTNTYREPYIEHVVPSIWLPPKIS